MTTRYKLIFEYDGMAFVGWQHQDNGLSVQAVVEEAVKRFSGETVRVYGAGRTDAGVHALGQVAHVDLEKDTRADKVRDALNYHMKPHPVAVVRADAVSPEFHARFSARQRHYLYRIVNRRAPLTVEKDLAWLVPVPLDAEAMHKAAQALVGTHDFTTFRASRCQAKSPVRTVEAIRVARLADEIQITVSAQSFLHNQVRSFVGSLKLVGEGKWTPRMLAKALEARDRKACGPIAPPEGLYLERVDY